MSSAQTNLAQLEAELLGVEIAARRPMLLRILGVASASWLGLSVFFIATQGAPALYNAIVASVGLLLIGLWGAVFVLPERQIYKFCVLWQIFCAVSLIGFFLLFLVATPHKITAGIPSMSIVGVPFVTVMGFGLLRLRTATLIGLAFSLAMAGIAIAHLAINFGRYESFYGIVEMIVLTLFVNPAMIWIIRFREQARDVTQLGLARARVRLSDDNTQRRRGERRDPATGLLDRPGMIYLWNERYAKRRPFGAVLVRWSGQDDRCDEQQQAGTTPCDRVAETVARLLRGALDAGVGMARGRLADVYLWSDHWPDDAKLGEIRTHIADILAQELDEPLVVIAQASRPFSNSQSLLEELDFQAFLEDSSGR